MRERESIGLRRWCGEVSFRRLNKEVGSQRDRCARCHTQVRCDGVKASAATDAGLIRTAALPTCNRDGDHFNGHLDNAM